MIMKPFSLDEYLKNPSRKVVTRDGRDVRIICTDRAYKDYPVVALVSNESAFYYRKDGKIDSTNYYNNLDLFFAPEKHEGWINIFKSSNDIAFLGQSLIYESKEDAERGGKGCDSYAATIKIEWEE